MGSDIHAHIEWEFTRNRMEQFAALDLTRNYVFFAAMAGVRSSLFRKVLFPPRGMPSDAAILTRKAYDEDPGHHASWLSLAEMEEVARYYSAVMGKYMPADYAAVLAAMRALGPTARIVFWFDS